MSRADDMETFDYIVVGAGSAGCALAFRLAESGRYSVALLEAGGPADTPWIHMPLGIGKLLQDERYVWRFQTQPEPGLRDTRVYWPRGRVVGGSSAINGMVYAWGEAAEYDAWRDAGNAGWGFEDVRPYFQRLENYVYPAPCVRGLGGPVRITHRGRFDPDPISDAFLAGCVEAGIPQVDDYNCGDPEGVSYLQQTAWRGRRYSSATAYLDGGRSLPNLRLIDRALVTRILFEGTRATGVECRIGHRTVRLAAGREVVLSAGTIQSPQILELSGVGDGSRLQGLGVPVVHHAPAVGENLQDHLQVRLSYECSLPLTINDVIGSRWRAAMAGLRYIVLRKGLLSSTSSSVHALARTRPGLDRPDVKIQIALISGKDRYSRSRELGIDPFPGFSLGVFRLHPNSRGACHAVSPDAAAPPEMRANYLADQEDLDTLVRGIRMMRRIASQPAMRGVVVAERRPGPSVETDEAVIDHIRTTGQTSWHPIGTCRMGQGPDAVVDERLRVRGIAGLRVADCSIMPTMASSNTNAPAMMIGEKAADLVLADAT